MLEFIQFSKRFAHEILWQDVNLTLPTKGLVMMSGPSGTGKTTFFRCLTQLATYQGKIRWQGVDLTNLTDQQQLAFRQHHVGYVIQGSGLMHDLTVADHVTMMHAIKGHDLMPIVHRWYQQLRMEIDPNQKVGSLSKGQQQRFAILLACLGHPSLLLLDEPVAGLDRQNRQHIYRMIQILQQHMLIIMSTHIVDEGMLNPHVILTFPLAIQQPQHGMLKKSFLPPLTVHRWFSSFWLWRFQFRHKKTDVHRWRQTFFQSISLGLFGVSLVLTFLIQDEVLGLVKTMLGGQYQMLIPRQIEPNFLHSTEEEDTVNLQRFPFGKLGYVYDEAYFEYLKPYQHVYVDYLGIQSSWHGFHLGLINQGEILTTSDRQRWHLPQTEEDEIILGIQPRHLRQLAVILNAFPVMDNINDHLLDQPLPIYISLAVPHWGYEDETVFYLRGVVLTEQPMWFLQDPLDSHMIYETRLRLPTKRMQDTMPPWYVGKTHLLWTDDHEAYLSTWRQDLVWHRYHVQRHHASAWRIYRQASAPFALPSGLTFNDPIHFHSELGYHYLPEQRLSGFALPTFFSASPMDGYLQSLASLREPWQWLQVPPPASIRVGHLLVNPQTAVKFRPTPSLASIRLDEVVLSTTLATALGLAIGDEMVITSSLFQEEASWGIIDLTVTARMTLVNVVVDADPLIFHRPFWWEDWLLMHGKVSSLHLAPIHWITFKTMTPPPQYHLVDPYVEVVKQVNQMQQYLWIGMILIGVWLMVPSIGLAWYYLAHQLYHDQARMRMLLGYGASKRMIWQWYAFRLSWMMMDITIPSLAIFLLIDYGLKIQIYQLFYLRQQPTFPSMPIMVFLGLMGLLTLIFLWLIQHPIQRALKKI